MKIILLIGVLLFTAIPALSDESLIVSSNNQFGVDLLSTHMDYTEIGDGSFGTRSGILDSEKGAVHGLSAEGSYMSRASKTYFSLQFSYSLGDTDYTGAPLMGNQPYGSLLGVTPVILVNARGRVGKGFGVNGILLTPYAELGWHLWHRGVNDGETYSYYHCGIGLLGQETPVRNLVLSAHFLLGRTFYPYIAVKNYFDGPLGDTAYSNAGVAADYALERQLHARLALDFTRFGFGRSAFYPFGTAQVWEPDSTSRYLTLKVGLGYAF